jgi:hypothetical protein
MGQFLHLLCCEFMLRRSSPSPLFQIALPTFYHFPCTSFTSHTGISRSFKITFRDLGTKIRGIHEIQISSTVKTFFFDGKNKIVLRSFCYVHFEMLLFGTLGHASKNLLFINYGFARRALFTTENIFFFDFMARLSLRHRCT